MTLRCWKSAVCCVLVLFAASAVEAANPDTNLIVFGDSFSSRGFTVAGILEQAQHSNQVSFGMPTVGMYPPCWTVRLNCFFWTVSRP